MSKNSPLRGRGRPNKAILTKENIADAALKIVTAKGVESLTMAALARSLGVATSALYNHVSGRDDVLNLVQELVMGQVDVTALERSLAGELDPREALEEWATGYRNAFSRLTPLVRVIALTPVADSPGTVAAYGLVTRVMEKAGVREQDIFPLLVALESFIFGSAFDVVAPAGIYDPGSYTAEGVYLRSLTLFDEACGAASDRADIPFHAGIAALLDAFLSTSRMDR